MAISFSLQHYQTVLQHQQVFNVGSAEASYKQHKLAVKPAIRVSLFKMSIAFSGDCGCMLNACQSCLCCGANLSQAAWSSISLSCLGASCFAVEAMITAAATGLSFVTAAPTFWTCRHPHKCVNAFKLDYTSICYKRIAKAQPFMGGRGLDCRNQ